MCHVILASPILALPLFFFLPFGAALPYYLAVIVGTGLVYFKILAAMKSRVQTGMESMTGDEAVVVEELKPTGKVRLGGEIWSATSVRGKLGEGKKVRVFGHEGLRLIVGESGGASDHAVCGGHGENRLISVARWLP
jgi:membrane-bound ClpP family serine protease